jgi:hypothetical protein
MRVGYSIHKERLLSINLKHTWVWAMIRMTLQYLFMILKSCSICFLPRASCHFLLALANAFFLDLYLKFIRILVNSRAESQVFLIDSHCFSVWFPSSATYGTYDRSKSHSKTQKESVTNQNRNKSQPFRIDQLPHEGN